MRNIHILTLLCIAFALTYCDDTTKNHTAAKSARNLAINKTNSYSTLFTDSATVESFINEQKLNDSISNDMRLFYNARNFQFAWFSGDGLTEQTFTLQQ
jgi:hypothetical protein